MTVLLTHILCYITVLQFFFAAVEPPKTASIHNVPIVSRVMGASSFTLTKKTWNGAMLDAPGVCKGKHALSLACGSVYVN